jgi:hypothetical protein
MPFIAVIYRAMPASAASCRRPVMVAVALPGDQARHSGGSDEESEHVVSSPRERRLGFGASVGAGCCANARRYVKKRCGQARWLASSSNRRRELDVVD